MSKKKAKSDLDLYWELMGRGESYACLQIEKRYGLDGYPPGVVTAALQAVAEGRDMDKAIDAMLGVDYDD